VTEPRVAVGGADAGLQERLDREISVFNAAASGHDDAPLSTHSFQAPGFFARLGYSECGRTPGYPNGHDDIHLVKHLP
jgi:hypothetical protein